MNTQNEGKRVLTINELIFNAKAEYNKWLLELTESEKELILEMLTEAALTPPTFTDAKIEVLAVKEYPELPHIINSVSEVRAIFIHGCKSASQGVGEWKEVEISEVVFAANSLDGGRIEMGFSEITTKCIEDDVFYYNNGIGEPVACLLSSLCVTKPQPPKSK